jgi:hypothetical protein
LASEDAQAVPDEPGKEDSYVGEIRNGVEVLDVKAIAKEPLTLDKFGIPIRGTRKTWDKI